MNNTTKQSTCGLCGHPMPEGEQMFKYHGYSGPCPEPPVKKEPPKVTPQNIHDAIVDEFYFTAAEGIEAHSNIPRDSIDLPDGVKLLTFCVLVLRNGFTIVGKSACVHPDTFDADVGRQVARQNAESQLWPLLGFALADNLVKHESRSITAMMKDNLRGADDVPRG